MTDLVFIENKETFTDHLTMARMFEKRRDNVIRDIKATIAKLSDPEFVQDAKDNGIDLSILRFEECDYINDEAVGANRNRRYIRYLLNFDAFMLVAMAYTTNKAMLVKVKFINEFRRMQGQLTQLMVARAKGKATRLEVVKAIHKYVPDSPNKHRRFKHYTDLTYKLVYGRNCKQLLSDKGLDKSANLRDHLSKGELELLDTIENEMSVLLKFNMDYHTIKEKLMVTYPTPAYDPVTSRLLTTEGLS